MNKEHFEFIKKCFQKKSIYNFSDEELQKMKDTIDLLSNRGVIQDLEVDNANAYEKIGDFSVFDEWYKEQDKLDKKATRSSKLHDVLIVILGAFFSGLVTFLLFKFFGIGG